MEPSPFALDTLSYPALLDALAKERSSCIVRVTDGLFDGEVHVHEGTVKSASFGNLRGSAALAAIAIAEPLQHSLILEPEPDALSRNEPGVSKSTLLGLGAPFDTQRTPSRPPPLPREATVSVKEERAPSLPAAARAPSQPPPLPSLRDSSPRLEIPPAPPAEGADVPKLESWALRTSNRYETQSERPARASSAPAPREALSVRAQPSIPPAVFARDRTVWIAVALCLPLIVLGLYRSYAQRSAPAVAAVAPKSVPVVAAALSAPKLAANTVPATLVASEGTLAPTVLVRVLVGEDGTVKQASAAAPRPGIGQLEKQAVESARGYRFEPAKRGDRPVESWTTLAIPFETAPGPRVVHIKGSETIGAALGPSWVRGFQAAHPEITVELSALGSSTGFAGLFDGSAQVAMASRPIKSEELAFAQRLGIRLRELVVGYDGIAVIVHPDNPVRMLDVETLGRVFSQQLTRWSELAGRDAAIHVLGRPSYSGTHTFMRERMLAALGPGGGFGASVENVESPQEIVDKVARDPNAIGYVSIGQLKSSVRALPLAPDKVHTAVVPSHETVRDGSYPIARPLYLYLRADSEYAARAWADYALSPEGQQEVEKQGFVPIQANMNAPLTSEVPAAHVEVPEVLRVFFAPNSATVEAASRPELASAAAALRAGKRVLLVGHADSHGKSDKNELLSKKRAETVARALRRASSQVSVDVEIAASNHPLSSNATEDGRHANRRVDLIIQNAAH